MKLQFIYVDTPFWRAEVGRIALFMGDVKFDDVRIKREDFFLKLKKVGSLVMELCCRSTKFPVLSSMVFPLLKRELSLGFVEKWEGFIPPMIT